MYLTTAETFKARAKIFVDFTSNPELDVHEHFYPLYEAILQVDPSLQSSYAHTVGVKQYGPALIDSEYSEPNPDFELPPMDEEEQRQREHEMVATEVAKEEAVKRIKVLCSLLNLKVIENIDVTCVQIEDSAGWYK